MFPTLLKIAAIALPATPAVLGVVAVDLDRGTTVVSVRAAEAFPMGSVYKLPIAMATLERIDKGDLHLDHEVTITPAEFAPGYSPIRDNAHGQPVTLSLAKLIDAMVSDSDNTAADALSRQVGGGARVTAYLRQIGIVGIRVDRTEKQIGADITADGVAAYNTDPRDTATPQAMVDLLRAIHQRQDGLSPASHDLLVSILTTSRNPHLLSKGLPSDAVLAHKSGNMPGVLNDVGLVTTADGKHHFAIAVFSKQAETTGTDVRAEAIAEIARRVYAAITSP